MASLVETTIRAFYGPEAVTKAAAPAKMMGRPATNARREVVYRARQLGEDVRAGMHYGMRNDPTHASFRALKRGQNRGFRAGAAATAPVGLALEHKGATAAVLGTGAAGVGTGVLVARRKKG